MARKKYSQQEIDDMAIALVRREKEQWELATTFVTEKVAFKMRQLIRICRKNYFGIFDNPYDKMTGLEMVWYPLTEINVEAVVKNIDLDTKDVNFRAKNPDGYPITDITRAYVRDQLDRDYFGQKLDDLERQLAIDGTAVWKTYEYDGKPYTHQVDLLNVFIDPTAASIQDAYRFTERSLMFADQIKGMTGWKNTDVTPSEGLPKTDPYYMNGTTSASSNVKAVDVYEMWGKVPKYYLTYDKNDTEEVDVQIVVSGLDSKGNEKCHLIEANKRKTHDGKALKPYEEAWYTRVPGRWYGRGVAEKLLMLQVYANVILNVRINRSRISQLGLFKVKKGSGITPQMLARLPSNGAVVMNSMDDLEQMVIQEVGASSYKDEEVINSLSERLTNAFEVATGEALPSSTPATNAALQNAAMKSGFAMVKEGLGLFIQRWMDRHYLPIIAKNLKKGDIMRLSSNLDNFKELMERVSMTLVLEQLDEYFAKGYVPSDAEIMDAVQTAQSTLMKGDTFVDVMQEIIAEQLDTQVFVTNEEMDVAVTVSNLINLAQVAPEYREPMVKQAYDLLGLGQLPKPIPQAMPGAPVSPQGGGNAAQLQAATTTPSVL